MIENERKWEKNSGRGGKVVTKKETNKRMCVWKYNTHIHKYYM